MKIKYIVFTAISRRDAYGNRYSRSTITTFPPHPPGATTIKSFPNCAAWASNGRKFTGLSGTTSGNANSTGRSRPTRSAIGP